MHEMAIRRAATMSAAAIWNAFETRPTLTVLRRAIEIPSIAGHADARRSSLECQNVDVTEMPSASWHSTCTGEADVEMQPSGLGGAFSAGDQTVIRLWAGVHCHPPVCFDV